MNERGYSYEPFVYTADEHYDRVDNEAFARKEFFADLHRLQDDLSTKIYEDGQALYIEFVDLTNAVNMQAKEHDIIGEHVTIIGSSDDILHPQIHCDPVQNISYIKHVRTEEREIDTVSGTLSHLSIMPEYHEELDIVDTDGTQQTLNNVYTPRICYMVQFAGALTLNAHMTTYYQCRVGNNQLEFSKDQRNQAEDKVIDTMRSMTDIEVGEEFQLLEDVLQLGSDPKENAHAARQASMHVHRLLNKSKIKETEKEKIEDLLVDVANLRLPSIVNYEIDTPYVLISGNISEKHADYDHILPDDDSGIIKYPCVAPLTISCLPRSYIAPHNSHECIVKRNQKALYITFLDDEENLYHIPLEFIKSLRPLD
jgi:hypothetical protein